MKKLKRYENEYFTHRTEEERKRTPLQRLEVDTPCFFKIFMFVFYLLKAENKRLTESCMRSEFENEMLALELVNDRIKLKESLHKVC